MRVPNHRNTYTTKGGMGISCHGFWVLCHISLLSVRTQIVSVIALCALAFGVIGVYVPSAFAQTGSSNTTLAELQAMIATLMAQITAIQGGGSVTPSPVTIGVGSSIETTSNLRVRSAASTVGIVNGTQKPGATGTIVGGPIQAASYTWYKVDFATGADGWVVAPWIKVVGAYVTDINSFVRTSTGDDNMMEPGAEDASIVKVAITPVVFDRYVNKVVLQFTPATSNAEDLPWVAFEEISLWSNSWKVLKVNAGDMGKWRKVGTGYQITVFTGNQKIAANRAYNLTIAVTSDEDTVAGDRWVVTTPKNGAVIWSQKNGHMTNKSDLTNYPIEFVGEKEDTEMTGISVPADSVEINTNVEGENGDLGDYEIDFEVTALDEDVYIRNVAQASSPKNTGVWFTVDGPSDPKVTAALDSTADETTSGVYVVREGETETFTVNTWVKPSVTGNYRVTLAGIMYSNEPTATKNLQQFIPAPAADYRTEYLVLQGSGGGSATTTNKYTIADVKAVTKKTVDPIPGAIDDEYTLYRIVLVNGKVHEVKVGFMPISYRDEQFRKTGFVGDIATLMAMAKATPVVPVTYEINISAPVENKTYKVGQTVVLTWNAKNLDAEYGIITLFGNNTERHLIKNVPLKAGSYSFKIPVTDTLGKVTDGTYKLSLWVTNVKDGEAKAVNDSVNIKITSAEVKPEVIVPIKNAFLCNRALTTKIANGTVGCYGMWDYGDNFGGDKAMCQTKDGVDRVGCVIKAAVCASGSAKATANFSNSSLVGDKLATVSANLKTTPSTVKAGVAGLWEYTCIPAVATTASSTPEAAVKGATIDVYSEIMSTLGTITMMLAEME